jgi:hypothetical protein
MIKFQFCVKGDCRIACQANNENDAWEWLSKTKHLSVTELKKLYKIKVKS